MPNRAWRDLDGKDPYTVLGVPRDATREEVTRAYRRRVRRLHPDVPGGSAEETTLLHLARDLLLDPVARAEYDSHTTRPDPADPPPEPDLPGAWDTEDVVTGIGPAPAEPMYVRRPAPEPPLVGEVVPEPFTPADGPYSYPPPPQPYQQYLYYRPYAAVRESLLLPIMALILAVLFAPVGLVVGLVALARSRRGGTARRISIIAVAIGAGQLACCIGWLGLAGLFQSPSSSP